MTYCNLDEAVMRNAFGPARQLEPSEQVVAAVIRQLGRRRETRVRRWIAVGILSLLVPAAAIALPPVRNAFSDVTGTFSGYFNGDGSEQAGGPNTADAPGRPLRGTDTPPAWLSADARTGQRLLATAGGYGLYVVKEPSGDFGFALGDSVGISDSAAGWEHQFAQNAVVVLGPGSHVDSDGVLPLYGVTAHDVTKVEIQYRTGPPTEADARDGGFVALAEPARQPIQLVALDQGGQIQQEVSLGYISQFSGS